MGNNKAEPFYRLRALHFALIAALGRSPGKAEARYNLIQALLESGDSAGARRELSALKATAPDYAKKALELMEGR